MSTSAVRWGAPAAPVPAEGAADAKEAKAERPKPTASMERAFKRQPKLARTPAPPAAKKSGAPKSAAMIIEAPIVRQEVSPPEPTDSEHTTWKDEDRKPLASKNSNGSNNERATGN